MNMLKKTLLFSIIILSASVLLPQAQTFVKKKRGGPSVTECCDMGVDLLSLSADLVQELGILQQKLVTISREMIDNNKKCYLVSADKEQLKDYFERTTQCKRELLAVHKELRSFNNYLETKG